MQRKTLHGAGRGGAGREAVLSTRYSAYSTQQPGRDRDSASDRCTSSTADTSDGVCGRNDVAQQLGQRVRQVLLLHAADRQLVPTQFQVPLVDVVARVALRGGKSAAIEWTTGRSRYRAFRCSRRIGGSSNPCFGQMACQPIVDFLDPVVPLLVITIDGPLHFRDALIRDLAAARDVFFRATAENCNCAAGRRSTRCPRTGCRSAVDATAEPSRDVTDSRVVRQSWSAGLSTQEAPPCRGSCTPFAQGGRAAFECCVFRWFEQLQRTGLHTCRRRARPDGTAPGRYLTR